MIVRTKQSILYLKKVKGKQQTLHIRQQTLKSLVKQKTVKAVNNKHKKMENADIFW